MTDTEREALTRRIDELCAENERLRQENQSIGMAAYELGRASMADENAELRKLANGYEALTATLCNERGCDGCPFDGTEQIVCEHMRLQTCLSELGIEVSDA